MQFCCNQLTLSKKNISISTSALETEMIFNKNALHERFQCIVRGCLLNSAQSIYQRIRRIIAFSNQITLILKCVDSDNAKRSFKSIKLLYNRFLNNIISYLNKKTLISHKNLLATYITHSLKSYAVMITLNCDDTR